VKFTYDPRHNIADIRFREKLGEVDSVRISDELVVDMAPDGTLYGIELLLIRPQSSKPHSPASPGYQDFARQNF
jgi:uncharacterized protein YuzE